MIMFAKSALSAPINCYCHAENEGCKRGGYNALGIKAAILATFCLHTEI
ncbi:hypothetical protein HBA_0589 [Sodalis endosymbiont of Henestaris halophilus]|nr:hypothetical protein HBA_0589 [Sodalis endosymbiont of Henestaris halophilus]